VGLLKSAAGLVDGFAVTLKNLFAPPETVRYPDEKPAISDRWRGIHGLFFHEGATEELCVSCCLCARVCPAQAIEMEGREKPDGRKELVAFDVDLGRCVFCGFCEEVCPVEAIRLTPAYEFSTLTREEMVLHKDDLIRIGKRAQEKGVW